MQVTVNFAQNNAELHDEVSHRATQSLKRVGLPITAILICLTVLMARGTSVAQTVSSTNATVPSDGQKAFEKMKTITGAWQGTMNGISINLTIRLASSGTTILQEATGDGKRPPGNEITMYYMEGDRLLATHYCDAGNRPRWEGKMSTDGKTIDFSFLDVAGGTQRGFQKDMAITIIDANKFVGQLTYMMPDGKPVEAHGEFQRIK